MSNQKRQSSMLATELFVITILCTGKSKPNRKRTSDHMKNKISTESICITNLTWTLLSGSSPKRSLLEWIMLKNCVYVKSLQFFYCYFEISHLKKMSLSLLLKISHRLAIWLNHKIQVKSKSHLISWFCEDKVGLNSTFLTWYQHLNLEN